MFIQAGGDRFSGHEAVEQMLRELVIVYDDGTPRTHHVTTNLVVDVDESRGTATARSSVTVFQTVDGLPLQPIAAGRYRDRYERHGSPWCFAERTADIHLLGDISRHLRRP